MLRLRLAALALGTVIAVGGAAAQPALATHYKQLNGNPLTIYIGSDGWFQELVAGNTDNSFFPRSQPQTSDITANAGFVLAFPSGLTGAHALIAGQVWGWSPHPSSNGPAFDNTFDPVSQTNWTGAGTSADPFTQVSEYEVTPVVTPLVEVVQTTTYVNGESNFVNNYAVKNLAADPLRFRALVGADVYLNGSDCGSGIFQAGPPRFVGGFSQGRVGGFTEASTLWTTYFEGPYGGPPGACEANPTGAPGVWDYLQGAESGAGFPGTIDPNFVDNGIGIQWDTHFASSLLTNNTAVFQLNTLGTVPGALNLTPSSQAVNAGSPAALTATATDSAGAAAAGILVRFTVSGANSTANAVATNAAGQASFAYTPSSGGTDTVVAFEDLDSNGVRGQGEPTASATVTVAASPSSGGPSAPGSSDKTPPRLTLIAPSKVKRKSFLRGLSVAARVNESASLKFELLGSPPPKKRPKTRTKARAFTRVLARQSLAMAGAGLRAARLRPSKKLVGKALKFPVQVRATATDRAGNKTVARRTIKVR